jgi:hypothetical protein
MADPYSAAADLEQALWPAAEFDAPTDFRSAGGGERQSPASTPDSARDPGAGLRARR